MKTVYAVYKDGVFQPEEPVSLAPGSRVEVRIPGEEKATVQELRTRFPNSCDVLESDEAEVIMRVIEEECERIEPDDWETDTLR